MTPTQTPAAALTKGDLYLFASGQTATIRFVHRTPNNKVRVAFTDRSIRAGACEPGTIHTVLR